MTHRHVIPSVCDGHHCQVPEINLTMRTAKYPHFRWGFKLFQRSFFQVQGSASHLEERLTYASALARRIQRRTERDKPRPMGRGAALLSLKVSR